MRASIGQEHWHPAFNELDFYLWDLGLGLIHKSGQFIELLHYFADSSHKKMRPPILDKMQAASKVRISIDPPG